MLVLSRKRTETIIINGEIKITVVRIKGNRVSLGIEAPADVSIRREEIVLNDVEAELRQAPSQTDEMLAPMTESLLSP